MATDEGVDETGDTDEVKRRFREALDRKQGKQASGTGTEETEQRRKAQGAHGPAHTQRQFRRKSGG